MLTACRLDNGRYNDILKVRYRTNSRVAKNLVQTDFYRDRYLPEFLEHKKFQFEYSIEYLTDKEIYIYIYRSVL